MPIFKRLFGGSTEDWKERVKKLAASGRAADDPELRRTRLYYFQQIMEQHIDSKPPLRDRVRINLTMEDQLRMVYDRPPSWRTRRVLKRSIREAIEELKLIIERRESRQP